MKAYLDNHIQEQKGPLESIPVDAVGCLINDFKRALTEDRQIFVFGNGGSASNTSHFVTGLGKSSSGKTVRRYRCHSLNEMKDRQMQICHMICYAFTENEELHNL